MAPIRHRLILACTIMGLIAGQPGYAQARQQNSPSRGAQLFASRCAFCHGADGKGGRAPAIAVLPQVIAMPNQALMDIVHNGKTSQGMPAFPDLNLQDTTAVVRYLRQLQGVTGTPVRPKPTGNANVGQELFFGKGQCSTCHMVNGKGGFIAQDLTAYAQTVDSHDVVQAIVDPDAHLEPGQQVVEVRTKKGKGLTGVLRSEDNIHLILQTENGRYHFLTKSDLAKISYTGHSLMPRDYGTRLTPAELNDLAAFLIDAGKNAPAEVTPASRRHRNSE